MAIATSSAVNLRTTLAGMIQGWRNEAVRTSIFIVTALILAFFILYPLGILFKWSLVNESTGVWSLNNYREFFSDPELYSALLTTLKLSVATSIGSLIIALPMAWGVSRTDMPLRGLVRSLVVLTFATPSFLIAVGWITLLGPRAGRINLFLQWMFSLESTPFNIFSFEGLVFALTMFVYPFLFFSVVSALDNMDPSYEQSARILGASTLRVSLTVTLPIVTPAILSGLILVIIESFVVFGVPAFLGAPVQIDTLSTLVYGLFSDDPPRFDMA
ncbi:MAG: iron ABC transporter permease, partial [Nitrospinaceae bacterium]|nr:iron ABC transporter permease [Nitrospinaceae bacterium]